MDCVVNRQGHNLAVNINHPDLQTASDRTDTINAILFGSPEKPGIFQDMQESPTGCVMASCAGVGTKKLSATYRGEGYTFKRQQAGGWYWLQVERQDGASITDELAKKIEQELSAYASK